MSWYKNKITLLLVALMFSNLPAVKAQGPLENAGTGIVKVASQDPAQDPATANAAANVPKPQVNLPTTRTGVDPTKTMKLSLRDAVTTALEHNLSIQAERENIKIAEFNLDGAYGVYDPTLGVEFNYLRSSSPSVDRFNSSASGSTINQSTQYNFSGSKFFETGGQVQAGFNNSRSSTNSNRAGLSPQFVPNFTVNATQPLLRNFRNSPNEHNVRRLQKQLDISDLTFRQRLITLIANVQAAYYDLGFAIANAEIQRESVELAAVQLRNNQIQVKAGTAAPIDIVSAEAELERRKDSAISALLPITQAENSLKTLLLDDPLSPVWDAAIIPTDPIDVSGDNIQLNDAIRIAMERRPEIKQLELQGDLNEIDLKYFKNQAKPQLDLTGGIGFQGVAGFAPPSVDPNTGQVVQNPFLGNYFDALGNILDFRTYRLGVTLNFPLRNRTAKANIGRTLAEGRQLDNQKKTMLQTIISDVRNALQAVENSVQRVEAARAAVRAAEEQLRGEEQKFAAGLSTNFFVLQRQNELSVARGNELQAKTDYNKARADLQRVMANNLP